MSEEGAASPGTDSGTTGGEEQSWQEQYLGGEEFAELRDNESIKDIPNVATLAKVWVDTKALVGRKGVIMPKEDATPEEWGQFYTELGRPATPEAYEIKPEGLPENFPYSQELEGVFRQLAFKGGLSPTQAKVIYDGYNKYAVEQDETARQVLKTQVAEMTAGLQKEWGNKYKENITLAYTAMNRIAPDGSPELLALDKAIGESPVLVKFFYNIGTAMDEGHFITGPGTPSADMENRRKQLMADPAYLDKKNPKFNAINEEVTAIYKKLYPEPVEQ